MGSCSDALEVRLDPDWSKRVPFGHEFASPSTAAARSPAHRPRTQRSVPREDAQDRLPARRTANSACSCHCSRNPGCLRPRTGNEAPPRTRAVDEPSGQSISTPSEARQAAVDRTSSDSRIRSTVAQPSEIALKIRDRCEMTCRTGSLFGRECGRGIDDHSLSSMPSWRFSFASSGRAGFFVIRSVASLSLS